MAFPTVQSITNTDFATAATDHNVSMPATVNSGDLLLMGFSYAHGADNDTPTTPTGWSSVITTGNSFSGEGRLTVYVKNANGSEGGGTVNVVTPTSHRAAATVYRITGWRNSGTILNDVEGAAVVSDGSNQSASTPGPPNLNPANWDVEDTLWIAFAAGFPGSGDVASYTSGPTGYGNFSSHGSGSGDDHALLATARSEAVLEKAKAEITRTLRQRHRLKPSDPDDFDVSSVREMAEMAEILTATMHILVAIIASISLLVGGIGIMNIMLVSVTERTREIGIRMAVGATGADILVQFLLEAIALSLIGGILGISLGIGGAVGAAYLAEWPLDIAPAVVGLAFLVSAGVGIFFGYYPALKAAQLDPIEALRYE